MSGVAYKYNFRCLAKGLILDGLERNLRPDACCISDSDSNSRLRRHSLIIGNLRKKPQCG